MLRDYQIEICRKVNEELEAHRSVMMQMPTGTGKTVVLASLVKQHLNLDNDAVGHCTSYFFVSQRMSIGRVKTIAYPFQSFHLNLHPVL